jgi:hypothetical protein
MRRSVAPVLVLAALVAPAAAQPGVEEAPPPAAPAPMTHDWSEVSHINGTPVPVGERGDYLVATPKKFNIATNPIGWLAGFYGISFAAAVSENITLRGNLEVFNYEFFGKTEGYEVALSAPIYLRRAFSGPFLEPGIIYQQTMDTPWDLFGDGDPPMAVAHTYVGPEVLFGWHWTFDSGFNIAAAIGVTRNLTAETTDPDGYDDGRHDPMPTGYVRVGYAF